MAITNLEKIFIVEMINVETYDVTTLPNAFVSLEDAYAYVDECRCQDERTDTAEWWTYRVRSFTLFR